MFNSPLWLVIQRKMRTLMCLGRKQSFLKKQFDQFAARYDTGRGFLLDWEGRRLMIGDNKPEIDFDAHYIYHPAWAARILAQIKPKEHVDISSALAFSAIISAFIPVRFYDYRPARLFLPSMRSERADLTALPFADDSLESISCMHTIEHIGLGRYGDPIDPDGDLRAISELIRVTKRGGSILFVVPVGEPRIVFNAHRIYSYEQVLSYFKGTCDLKDIFLIPDDANRNGPIYSATTAEISRQKYGCGCFWFQKI